MVRNFIMPISGVIGIAALLGALFFAFNSSDENEFFAEYKAKCPPQDSIQASFSLLSDVPIKCQRFEFASFIEEVK